MLVAFRCVPGLVTQLRRFSGKLHSRYQSLNNRLSEMQMMTRALRAHKVTDELVTRPLIGRPPYPDTAPPFIVCSKRLVRQDTISGQTTATPRQSRHTRDSRQHRSVINARSHIVQTHFFAPVHLKRPPGTHATFAPGLVATRAHIAPPESYALRRRGQRACFSSNIPDALSPNPLSPTKPRPTGRPSPASEVAAHSSMRCRSTPRAMLLPPRIAPVATRLDTTGTYKRSKYLHDAAVRVAGLALASRAQQPSRRSYGTMILV